MIDDAQSSSTAIPVGAAPCWPPPSPVLDRLRRRLTAIDAGAALDAGHHALRLDRGVIVEVARVVVVLVVVEATPLHEGATTDILFRNHRVNSW